MCQVMQKYEEIARNEGIRQEKIRNARSMLKMGLSPEMVAKCLEITQSQLNELLAQ